MFQTPIVLLQSGNLVVAIARAVDEDEDEDVFQTLIVLLQSGNKQGQMRKGLVIKEVSNPYRITTVGKYEQNRKIAIKSILLVSNPYRITTVGK